MASKYYVATEKSTLKRVLLRLINPPTEESHGEWYMMVIGPFKTMRGAEFMRDYGQNNPHCQSVSDAERLAKQGHSGYAIRKGS